MGSIITDDTWSLRANPDIAYAVHMHPTIMLAFAACGPCAFPAIWERVTPADLAAIALPFEYLRIPLAEYRGGIHPPPAASLPPETHKDKRSRLLAVAQYWALHDPYRVYHKHAGLWVCNRSRLPALISGALANPKSRSSRNLSGEIYIPPHQWPGYTYSPDHFAKWAQKMLEEKQ